MVSRRNPAPLSPRQVRALTTSAARELRWGLRAVKHEHARWVRCASAIPDAEQRRHALDALGDKRPLLDGAALFWTIPDRRDPELLRLLVAFQILANYHDHASERAGAGLDVGSPGSSMETFVEVVDLERPPHGYRDSRYLATLVETCRDGCARLPRYADARGHLVREAGRARTLDLEHVEDRGLQVELLRRFADVENGGHGDLSWFEQTAGSSSLLTAIVSLALAARPDTAAEDLAQAVNAYTKVATLSALLDNYVDHADDVAAGTHNYLTYYATPGAAMARLGGLVDETLHAVGRLRHGERHRLIVGSMVAMYLTSDGAREPGREQVTRQLAARGGSLVALLIPILSLWRHSRGEGSA